MTSCGMRALISRHGPIRPNWLVEPRKNHPLATERGSDVRHLVCLARPAVERHFGDADRAGPLFGSCRFGLPVDRSRAHVFGPHGPATRLYLHEDGIPVQGHGHRRGFGVSGLPFGLHIGIVLRQP